MKRLNLLPTEHINGGNVASLEIPCMSTSDRSVLYACAVTAGALLTDTLVLKYGLKANSINLTKKPRHAWIKALDMASRDLFSESCKNRVQVITMADPATPEIPLAFILATSPTQYGTNHIVEIINIYVNDEYRTQGVGASLVKAIRDQSLRVAPNAKFLIRASIDSVGFWEKMGFSQVDVIDAGVVMSRGKINPKKVPFYVSLDEVVSVLSPYINH